MAPKALLASLITNIGFDTSLLIILIPILLVAIFITVIIWTINISTNKNNVPNTVIKEFGFAYNPKKDIFYSTMDAWQRKFGYCELYDEAAAPLRMIIDSEPIRFEYEGKKWLIELWKGQYGMTTGGEIGVYTTDDPDFDIDLLDFFIGTFYNMTNDEDHLRMSFELIKNNKLLFSRKGKHWWLTGFKLGEFSEPDELIMEAEITLKTIEMRRIFVSELKRIGYSRNEYRVEDETVYITFTKPYSPQPATRTKITDALVQQNNKELCDLYQQITGDFDNSLDKLIYIKKHDRKMYKSIVNAGNSKKLYAGHKTIMKNKSKLSKRRG